MGSPLANYGASVGDFRNARNAFEGRASTVLPHSGEIIEFADLEAWSGRQTTRVLLARFLLC